MNGLNGKKKRPKQSKANLSLAAVSSFLTAMKVEDGGQMQLGDIIRGPGSRRESSRDWNHGFLCSAPAPSWLPNPDNKPNTSFFPLVGGTDLMMMLSRACTAITAAGFIALGRTTAQGSSAPPHPPSLQDPEPTPTAEEANRDL